MGLVYNLVLGIVIMAWGISYLATKNDTAVICCMIWVACAVIVNTPRER
jgi:hypothetical protein